MTQQLVSSRTIAAIATGSGGGVGIVRVSGPQALQIGQRVCAPWPSDLLSHHLYLGHAQSLRLGGQMSASGTSDPQGTAPSSLPARIDQVLFVVMRAPHSYTGEDVLEIHGHGGAITLHLILEACLDAGADSAAPGEFTRRAFLAGKLDLTAAEAVAQLVSAQSVSAARQAQRQLHGELGRVVAELRRRLTVLLGDFEGMLDFPDLDADTEVLARAQPELAALSARISSLASTFHRGGKALSRGLELALLGKTNAGKSSLINALCGSERVLVDARPGTTRDFVEVRTQWGSETSSSQGAQDLTVTLIDTAGEREGATDLELAGMRLGRQRWQGADLALLVVDGTVGMGPEESALLALRPPALPYLVVWNKSDHQGCLPPPAEAIACSALCGWGLPERRRQVLQRLAPQLGRDDELLIVSERQALTLQQCTQALQQAQSALALNAEVEVIAAELRTAALRLGELTGDEITPGVLDSIFARFCVGK